MKTKNIFKWPKEVYIFWLTDFLLGVELIGPVLLVFFKDWGGLNQTQTQMLQSWFMFWIFILEIPTGVYGDVKGKKVSVILGYLFYTIGTLTYTLIPNIYMFLLSEFILALGTAFISGAKEAWMYDIAKKKDIQNEFRTITVISSSLHMGGMIIASVIFIFVSKYFTVQEIFRISAIPYAISLPLLGLLIPPTDGKKEKLEPNYLQTTKDGFQILKNSKSLRKYAIYTSILASTSYFVIWLYQEALRVLSVPENLFGAYRMILLVSEIFVMCVIAKLMKKWDIRKTLVVIAITVAIGFILGGVFKNIVGVIFVLAFAGGLGLQVPSLLSKEINEEIVSDKRATVLSFVSMVRRLMLTIFNPFIGFLVDSKGVFVVFAILGCISLLAIFFKPKILR